ncbi:hypothetical protein ACHELR_000700 [Vibrio fluvialis]
MAIETRFFNEITELFVDGRLMKPSGVSIRSREPMLQSDDSEGIAALLRYNVNDLPPQIKFYGDYSSSIHSQIDWFSIERNKDKTTFSVSTKESVGNWNYPYTINEYISNLRNVDSRIEIVLEDEYLYAQLDKVLDSNDNLLEQYNALSIHLYDSYTKCHQAMTKSSQKLYLLKAFRFPIEYQSICSQYLIWFGEFLENFGINALISVSHQGKETQVSVSSEHTDQMFREIEALFSQYIALPYAEFLPAHPQRFTPEQQFLVTQLQTQINHFKGQLEMKSAALQLKEATIQSMQNTIDVQKNQLLLIESIQGDEEVEILGGIITLGVIEWGPFKFKPKKLLDKNKDKE